MKYKHCIICKKSIINIHSRKFCSVICRESTYTYQRYKKRYQEWARKKRGVYKSNKLQCKLCKKWYIQVGTHVTQRHGILARDYKEQQKLPVKRGIIPKWYRKEKGDIALKNGTYHNLEKGKEFYFRKGQDVPNKRKGKHYKDLYPFYENTR